MKIGFFFFISKSSVGGPKGAPRVRVRGAQGLGLGLGFVFVTSYRSNWRGRWKLGSFKGLARI